MSNLCMVGSNEPRETAKDTILNLATILTEIKAQVDLMDSAIYGNRATILTEIKAQVDLMDSAIYGNRLEETTANDAPSMPPILTMLRQQRDFAEDILKGIVHIREGLL